MAQFILVPTDFSVYSDNALKKAVEIAARDKSKICLLHVVDELIPFAQAYCLDSSLVERTEAQFMKVAEEKLHNEVQAIGASNNVEIVFDLKKGDVAETILKAQKDKGIDLIVLASHGYKTIPNQVASVSRRILREADCPVMMTKILQ